MTLSALSVSPSYTVASTAELLATLKTLKGGETVILSPGKYDGFLLRDTYFADRVTLRSADPNAPATFTSEIKLSGVSGINFENLTIDVAELPAARWVHALNMNVVSDLTFTGLTVSRHIPTTEGVDIAQATNNIDVVNGYAYGGGVGMIRGRNIVFDAAEVKNVFGAFMITESTDLAITNSEIHQVREGINVTNVENVRITDNFIHDFHTIDRAKLPAGVDGDHADMIGYFNTPGRNYLINKNVVIDSNILFQGDGDLTQSIFGHAGPGKSLGLYSTDFQVTNNIVINSQFHGVTLGDIRDTTVANNILLPAHPFSDAPGFEKYPLINLPWNASNMDMTDNLFVSQAAGWLKTLAVNAPHTILHPSELPNLGALVATPDTALELINRLKAAFPAIVGDFAAFPDTVFTPDSTPAPPPVPNEDTGVETPTLNVVEGTAQSEALYGADGADLILGRGGAFDNLYGRGGADVFAFRGETTNGARELVFIHDYQAGVDSLDLGGAFVTYHRAWTHPKLGDLVQMTLSGDSDGITVVGATSFDAIDFI